MRTFRFIALLTLTGSALAGEIRDFPERDTIAWKDILVIDLPKGVDASFDNYEVTQPKTVQVRYCDFDCDGKLDIAMGLM